MALTAKQDRFIAEYLVDLNATQAAIRAGYSRKTASSQGERLLRNVEVRSAIQAAQAKRLDRIKITQDDVVRGLYREAERTGEGSSHAARVQAWTQLGKHLGMFVIRLGGPDGGPIIVNHVNLKELPDDDLERLDSILSRSGGTDSPVEESNADAPRGQSGASETVAEGVLESGVGSS